MLVSTSLPKEENNSRRKIKELALILLNEDNSLANTSVEICLSWFPMSKEGLSKNKTRLQNPICPILRKAVLRDAANNF